MNDPVIIGTQIGLIITTLGSVIVLIINTMSASKDRRESALLSLKQIEIATETRRKSDQIIEQGVQIHTLANSTNSNLQKSLELMTEKAAGMQKLIEEMILAKRDTAQAQQMMDQRTALAMTPGPALSSGKNNAPTEVVIKNPGSDPVPVVDHTKK